MLNQALRDSCFDRAEPFAVLPGMDAQPVLLHWEYRNCTTSVALHYFGRFGRGVVFAYPHLL